MKSWLLLLGGILLLVGSLLLYSESITIMRGDYILSRWIGVDETNKSWFLIFFLGIVGGSLTYIVYKLLKRRKLRGS